MQKEINSVDKCNGTERDGTAQEALQQIIDRTTCNLMRQINARICLKISDLHCSITKPQH